jgi:hypothetical protein
MWERVIVEEVLMWWSKPNGREVGRFRGWREWVPEIEVMFLSAEN